MNTPSHWLMTIAASKCGSWAKESPKWALGLGSVAPDIPLYFLSLGGIWYFGQYLGWSQQDVGRHLFQNLFYDDPIWITLHNFLHSPTMLLMLGWICWWFRFRGPRVSRWMAFFLGACLLHSIVDIFTHNDDGPLIWFPFDWSYRFASLISYWDSDHYGLTFMKLEAVLDLGLIGFLVGKWWKNRSGEVVDPATAAKS